MPRRVWDERPAEPKASQTVDPFLKAQVFARQRGLCACCGAPLKTGWHPHHRKLRSQGGKDTLDNLVGLLGTHHRSVHDHPARSSEFGFIVLRDEDPAAKPLHLYDGRRVLLLPDGTTQTVKGEAA